MRPPAPARPARGVADRQVDPTVAHEVAAAYLGAPARRDPLTRLAYARLVAESDQVCGWMTSPDRPDPMRVAFTTCPTPYDDARELIDSVRDDGVLEVATVANDRDSAPPTDGQRHGR
jgi:hypothetical protein